VFGEPINTAAQGNDKLMATRTTKKGDSTATIGFEAKRWLTADKLRNNMDAAEYKHVVLGLIFLKYISDTFEEHHARLIDVDCDGDSDAGQVNTYGHDSNAATRRSTAPTGSPNTTTRARTSASGQDQRQPRARESGTSGGMPGRRSGKKRPSSSSP
jgi:hypothetical protein